MIKTILHKIYTKFKFLLHFSILTTWHLCCGECLNLCGKRDYRKYIIMTLAWKVKHSRLVSLAMESWSELGVQVVREFKSHKLDNLRVIAGVISLMESESEESEHFHFFRLRHLWSSENRIVRSRKQRCKNQPITRPRIKHHDWFVLPLLLQTPTI